MARSQYEHMGVQLKANIIESMRVAEERVRKIHGAPEYPCCPICNGQRKNPLLRVTCQWCGITALRGDIEKEDVTQCV